MIERILKGGVTGFVLSTLLVGCVSAYSIEQLPTTPVNNDYVVGPGKTEIRLNAGEVSVKNIVVTNRFGKERRFNIEIEDFSSSKTARDGSVELMGVEKGPYSLRDYIKPDVTTFVLQQGDRANVPVTIDIPKDATPGGLYGAIIITTEPTDPLEAAKENEAKGTIILKSRIASLFFVRINGDVNEDGSLQSFQTDGKYFKSGPIKFTSVYENRGSIYTNPYGVIEVSNLYGTVVDQVSIQPYFVMPGATREMSLYWDHGFMMGRYKATISLNRGYGDQVDTKTVTFWVLPWKVIAGILIGLFLLLLIIGAIKKWFKANFEYKGGKKDSTPPSNTPPQS